jgi:hypothetical protein
LCVCDCVAFGQDEARDNVSNSFFTVKGPVTKLRKLKDIKNIKKVGTLGFINSWRSGKNKSRLSQFSIWLPSHKNIC